jgi:hypothetical protein
MPTTKIATESARPSLTQNIVDLYNSVHVGGAYDAKKQLLVTGGHNELIDNFGTFEATITAKGFKTKMSEGQSEFIMVTTGKETTRMLTSVYGHHSTKKYWNM